MLPDFYNIYLICMLNKNSRFHDQRPELSHYDEPEYSVSAQGIHGRQFAL